MVLKLSSLSRSSWQRMRSIHRPKWPRLPPQSKQRNQLLLQSKLRLQAQLALPKEKALLTTSHSTTLRGWAGPTQSHKCLSTMGSHTPRRQKRWKAGHRRRPMVKAVNSVVVFLKQSSPKAVRKGDLPRLAQSCAHLAFAMDTTTRVTQSL